MKRIFKPITAAQEQASYAAGVAWNASRHRSPVAGIAAGIRSARNPKPLDLARRERDREDAKRERAKALQLSHRRGRYAG